MKRLTLNKTWELCLAMWRWIAEEARKGNTDTVHCLKSEWLSANGFGGVDVADDCFFCEYTMRGKGGEPCRLCPGKKVDPRFYCMTAAYDFEEEPIAFYNKLVAFNKKRLKK